jgi:uncharacterized membrane protein
MPVAQILVAVACLALMALFGFQLSRVMRTGHVRWRVQKVHRDHRPVAFWVEVAACVIGLLLFAGVFIATLMKLWAAAPS